MLTKNTAEESPNKLNNEVLTNTDNELHDLTIQQALQQAPLKK
jgi:hypothetical protein